LEIEVVSPSQAVSEMIENYLEENPNDARIIVQKVILAASNKSKKVQRKTVMGGWRWVNFLIVQSKIPKCEVYLEGDSQGERLRRDRKFQAILLRGKILNVEKAMHHKVFENEEIRNIFTALGVTVGTAEDSKALNMDNYDTIK
jgi:DNA gyrase subunit B